MRTPWRSPSRQTDWRALLARQSGRFLEIGSLHPPLAALRRFPRRPLHKTPVERPVFSFPQAFRHSPGHFALRRDLLCPRRQRETNATPFFSGLSEKNGVARQKEIAFATVLSCSFVWCFVIGKGESVDELVQPPSPLPLIRCAKECPAQTCERSRRISSVRRSFDKFVRSLHQAMHKRQR